MHQDRCDAASTAQVVHYRREITRILEVLGHPEAFVTDASILSDFPLREEPSTPTVTELTSALGIRVEPQHRLVDIARWLGERDAAALLLTLMRAIDEGDAVERLKAMVDGWRRNALEALAADDYRADVDTYLEVSVDARLYLLARPALLRHLEDLEDEDDDASLES